MACSTVARWVQTLVDAGADHDTYNQRARVALIVGAAFFIWALLLVCGYLIVNFLN